MKRIAVILCATLGFALGNSGAAHAGWGSIGYSGYQPWYNVFAKRNKCMTVEEERLQKFWHDYYDAMRNYYSALDKIDWVAYYKNHGYPLNGNTIGGNQRVNYAPVFVSPSIQWAVPNTSAGGSIPAPEFGPGPGGPGQ
jgi:hypothetical protein